MPKAANFSGSPTILTLPVTEPASSTACAIRGLPANSRNALSVPIRELLPPARTYAVNGSVSKVIESQNRRRSYTKVTYPTSHFQCIMVSPGRRLPAELTPMPQKLLDVLLLGRCSHEFSWPRRAADGQFYQVCLLCAAEYKYDWTTMRRTERVSQEMPEEISGQKNSKVLCQGRVIRMKEPKHKPGQKPEFHEFAASILDYKFIH